MWPTWGPPGSCRPQVGPTLAPSTLLSGKFVQFGRDVTLRNCHGRCERLVRGLCHKLAIQIPLYFSTCHCLPRKQNAGIIIRFVYLACWDMVYSYKNMNKISLNCHPHPVHRRINFCKGESKLLPKKSRDPAPVSFVNDSLLSWTIWSEPQTLKKWP